MFFKCKQTSLCETLTVPSVLLVFIHLWTRKTILGLRSLLACGISSQGKGMGLEVY